MSLLVPETGLLFWMTISFGIAFFILAKFGFPVITNAVEERNQYIEKSLDDARKAEEKVAVLNEQAGTILQEARSQRNTILDEAQEVKIKMMNEAKEVAESEARIRLKRATLEIEESKKKALISLREEITGISVKIAEKVLGEKLRDDEQQRALLNHIMDNELVVKV